MKRGGEKKRKPKKRYSYSGRRIQLRFRTDQQLQDLHRAAELAGKSTTNEWAIGILNLAVFKMLERQEVRTHGDGVLMPQGANENGQ